MNHYIEFNFQAASGYKFDLVSLNFLGESTGTGADDVAFMTSVDGFTAGDELLSLTGVSTVTTGGFDTDSSGFGGGTVSLTGSQYQGITQISFRLYGWNTSSGFGATYLRSLTGNDVTLNGSVSAVPEPGTFALIAGCLGLTFVMMKRRQA